MTDDKLSWVIYSETVRGRSCGSCKLCCTLLPVDLANRKKPANEKCEHLCSKGCSIYDHRADPCRYFNCRWLFDDRTGHLRRPDKVGYVIDPMLDGIVADGNPCDVIQVWVDPNRRDAHTDPALRDYLSKMAEIYGFPAIIRWSSTAAMLLVAPCLTESGEWVELVGDKMNLQTELEMKKIYNAAIQGKL